MDTIAIATWPLQNAGTSVPRLMVVDILYIAQMMVIDAVCMIWSWQETRRHITMEHAAHIIKKVFFPPNYKVVSSWQKYCVCRHYSLSLWMRHEFLDIPLTSFDGQCRYGSDEFDSYFDQAVTSESDCRLECASLLNCVAFAYDTSNHCHLFKNGPYTYGDGSENVTCYILRECSSTCSDCSYPDCEGKRVIGKLGDYLGC